MPTCENCRVLDYANDLVFVEEDPVPIVDGDGIVDSARRALKIREGRLGVLRALIQHALNDAGCANCRYTR